MSIKEDIAELRRDLERVMSVCDDVQLWQSLSYVLDELRECQAYHFGSQEQRKFWDWRLALWEQGKGLPADKREWLQ